MGVARMAPRTISDVRTPLHQLNYVNGYFVFTGSPLSDGLHSGSNEVG